MIPDYAQPLIDAGRVREIMLDCLAGSSPDAVVVEGVMSTFGFNRDKLAEHRLEIVGMLVHLPMQFRPTPMGGGGGWSFLNACNDSRGEQWTGEHRAMEALLCLGIGTGDAEWLLPREMWDALPGRMPYVAVKV